MSNIPSSSARDVPSIHVHDADGASALFDDFYKFFSEDAGLYSCSRGLQSGHPSLNSFPSPSSELDDMPELSHLSTTPHGFLTGHGYSLPYSTVLQEDVSASANGGLSPSNVGSPAPSPTSSFTSSLSPSSLNEPVFLSDSESPISLSPAMPDQVFFWSSQVQGLNSQSSDSLMSRSCPLMGSNDPFSSIGCSAHRRTRSSPSARCEPVASKAMLEANSRRRRHPAQFECPDCGQTFTALFSLKRHAQSHTGERPFKCSIPGCSQRFYNSSDCKRHEKSRKRHKDMMQ